MSESRTTSVADWLLSGRFTGLSCERRDGYERELEVIRKEIIQCAAINSGDVVLDVGCGTGFILQGLIGQGLKLIGLDQDAGVLAEARRRLGKECRLIQSGVTRIPLAMGEINVVVGRSVYVYARSLGQPIGEMVRILAADGRYSLFEPLDRQLIVDVELSSRSRELLALTGEYGLYNRDFRSEFVSACAEHGLTVSTRSRPSEIELCTEGDVINRLFHVAPPGYAPVDVWRQHKVARSDIDQCVWDLKKAAGAGLLRDRVVYGFFCGKKQ